MRTLHMYQDDWNIFCGHSKIFFREKKFPIATIQYKLHVANLRRTNHLHRLVHTQRQQPTPLATTQQTNNNQGRDRPDNSRTKKCHGKRRRGKALGGTRATRSRQWQAEHEGAPSARSTMSMRPSRTNQLELTTMIEILLGKIPVAMRRKHRRLT